MDKLPRLILPIKYESIPLDEDGKFCKNYNEENAQCKTGCKGLDIEKNQICPLTQSLQNKCPCYR